MTPLGDVIPLGRVLAWTEQVTSGRGTGTRRERGQAGVGRDDSSGIVVTEVDGGGGSRKDRRPRAGIGQIGQGRRWANLTGTARARLPFGAARPGPCHPVTASASDRARQRSLGDSQSVTLRSQRCVGSDSDQTGNCAPQTEMNRDASRSRGRCLELAQKSACECRRLLVHWTGVATGRWAELEGLAAGLGVGVDRREGGAGRGRGGWAR